MHHTFYGLGPLLCLETKNIGKLIGFNLCARTHCVAPLVPRPSRKALCQSLSLRLQRFECDSWPFAGSST